MESIIADKINEIRNLDHLARQKRKELEAQLARLSQERSFHQNLANQLKIEIRELRESLKNLPPVQVPDLGEAILATLDDAGPKTLRELGEITGLKSKAISQCLQTLVKRGVVIPILAEGRKRGASYRPVSDPGRRSKSSRNSAPNSTPDSLSFPL
jgi:predicted transcriptional regulator